MRVTDSMLFGNAINNLSRNLERYVETQRQVATGKRMASVSDDPVGASASLRAKVRIAELDQYSRNIDDAKLWMGFTDNALDQAVQLVREARDTAVAGANGTESEEQLAARASQVGLIIDQLIQIGNSTYNGRRIFGGQDTKGTPFTAVGDPPTGVTYSSAVGADQDIRYEVGPDTYQVISVRGDEAFGDGETPPVLVFQTLIALRDNLSSGDQEAISSDRLSELDAYLDRILQFRAEVGTKTNALDSIQTNLSKAKQDLVQVRSSIEDVDMAQAITDLQQRENVYQASMLATARIENMSLAKYLS